MEITTTKTRLRTNKIVVISNEKITSDTSNTLTVLVNSKNTLPGLSSKMWNWVTHATRLNFGRIHVKFLNRLGRDCVTGEVKNICQQRIMTKATRLNAVLLIDC